MNPFRLTALVQILGFSTGVALYGMLLILALRHRDQLRSDRLPLLAGALGMTWNIVGLLNLSASVPVLLAIGYAALGFLPAVVVHSVLGSRRAELTIASYCISAAAAVMTIWSAPTGVVPWAPALRLLSWSFAAIAVPLFYMTRREHGLKRAWWIFALAVFAVSALHLSGPQHANESWPIQLIGHHASLGLIFAILYQDYRFAFADTFFKRGLTLFVVVATSLLAFTTLVQPLLRAHGMMLSPAMAGTLLLVWIGSAFLYPVWRDAVSWFVDRVVLRRPDYALLKEEIERMTTGIQDAELLLQRTCDELTPALAAEGVLWREVADRDRNAVAVPTVDAPRYAFVVGRLKGGRRLLSDDIQLLQSVAASVGRRIDAIRIERERVAQRIREEEISKLAAEAELRALRAQVNPHFLFNALNTVGYLVQTSPALARTTLMKLTSLLRSVLRSGSPTITIGEEIDLVSAYLDIERARFEERLRVRFDVSEDVREISIPPLLVQPLVENAVKHGIGGARAGGEVVVRAIHDDEGILLAVTNTGAMPTEIEIARGRRTGTGLRNVEERLRLIFGDRASFALRVDGAMTVAEIKLPVEAGLARPA